MAPALKHTEIIVPFVPGMLHSETQQWAFEHHAKLCQLDPYDEGAYWCLLAREWMQPGHLIIVEQDVVPAPGVIDRMINCRRPWCTSPYPIGIWQSMLECGLGCVKIAARVKERFPELMLVLGEKGNDGLPPKNWRRLDTRLANMLTDETIGYKPHAHKPYAKHLHDYRTRP